MLDKVRGVLNIIGKYVFAFGIGILILGAFTNTSPIDLALSTFKIMAQAWRIN